MNIGRHDLAQAGERRAELLAAHREAGVDRVMGLLQASATDDEALALFAEDAHSAGCTLTAPAG